jgi:hypothetical protein
MNRDEWKCRYIDRLMARGLDREMAEATAVAGQDDFDYEDSPEEAADDELSYWGD